MGNGEGKGGIYDLALRVRLTHERRRGGNLNKGRWEVSPSFFFSQFNSFLLSPVFVQCGKPAAAEDYIVLNGTQDDMKSLGARIAERRVAAKEAKVSKTPYVLG